MPDALALKTRGRELAEAVKTVMNDAELTGAQKSERLEAIQKDLEAHEVDVKNSEMAANVRAKLGISGDAFVDADNLEQKGYRARSLGEQAVAHPDYKSVVEALGGAKGLGAKGEFRKSFEIGTKDASVGGNLMGDALNGTTAAAPLAAGSLFLPGTAGQAVMPNFLPGIVDMRFFPLTIADLMPSGGTDSPVISYLKEASWTDNAAAVAEGGTFPASSNQLARVEAQVGKVANLITVTDEMIRDAPQFFSFVQNRLTFGVQRQEEVQLLAGAGAPGVGGLLSFQSGFTQGTTGLTALTNVSFPAPGTPGSGTTAATVASITPGRQIKGASTGVYPTASAIAEGLMESTTDIYLNSWFVPDALIMNPYDWQIVRLGKDANGQYFGGSFFGADYGNMRGSGPSQSLWGQRVVVTPAIPQGIVLNGNFREACQIFRREGITVQMTNSDSTDFQNGLVKVRAEERLGLACYRPGAFEVIQITNG
ncbi:phage major capsid protein [Speluncibacter jeojiensis]|uniref:Phage major capsid protein n=1 Tax=Speluncibacter jeojiensis TaxID=2710754 RepID=A0A9X4RCG8_9ACTN|nr:phage major capsid protein [Corynebacteriales bacterium D3-21]